MKCKESWQKKFPKAAISYFSGRNIQIFKKKLYTVAETAEVAEYVDVDEVAELVKVVETAENIEVAANVEIVIDITGDEVTEDVEAEMVVDDTDENEEIIYKNCLMKNCDFYRSNRVLKNYVVAKSNKDTLMISDYITLNEKNQLTNFLIEFVLDIFVEKFDNFQYFKSSDVSYKILGKFSAEFVNSVKFTKRYSILPVHIHHPYSEKLNHWCLVILDTQLKQFLYFNSLRKKSHSESAKYFDRFKFFLQKLSDHQPESNLGSIEEWSIQNMDHNLQKDGYNCGVHILHFVQQMGAHGYTFDDLGFNANHKRMELKEFILKNSKCMESICLVCGSEDEPGLPKTTEVNWISCEKCTRWIHFGCSKEIIQKDTLYICPLCANQKIKKNQKII